MVEMLELGMHIPEQKCTYNREQLDNPKVR